jgi:folate-dependent phosphoribosylglycinamide formyltransferase PurN
MKVALFSTATGDKWSLFANTYCEALREQGIEIAVAVLDDQEEKRQNHLRHARNVAARQARVAGCSVPAMLARIVVYKSLTRSRGAAAPGSNTPTGTVATVHVKTLNSDEAVDAVRSRGCEMVCLMGTRIITNKTLGDLGVPVVNIHSSDPAFVRGGPPVVWEILDRRDSIMLTIHDVIEKLDAGAILRQVAHPICNEGGLAATISSTMRSAKPEVAELFYRTLVDCKHGEFQRTEFVPGVLRVTPSIAETLRADRLCRARSRPDASRSAHRRDS